MLKITLVFLATACIVYADVQIAKLEEKPEEFKCVEGCFLADLGDVLAVGARRPSPSSCHEYLCHETFVQMFGCGAVGVKPSCRLVSDSTQLYPDCCPKEQCDNI